MAAYGFEFFGSRAGLWCCEPFGVAFAEASFCECGWVYGWWVFVVGWVAFGWHWGPFFVFECVFVLGVVGCGLGLPGFGVLSCFGCFKRFDPLWVGSYTSGGMFVALRGH